MTIASVLYNKFFSALSRVRLVLQMHQNEIFFAQLELNCTYIKSNKLSKERQLSTVFMSPKMNTKRRI